MMQPDVVVKTPEQVDLQFTLAGIGSRAFAQVLDLLILAVIYGLFLTSIILWQWLNVFGHATSYIIGFLILFSFLLFWGYFIAFEYFLSGRTLGKRWVRIRVISADGRPLSFFAAAVRNLLRLIDVLPSGYLLGVVVMMFDRRERRIGDIVAGSLVVVDRPRYTLTPFLSHEVPDDTRPGSAGANAIAASGTIVTVPQCPCQLTITTPLPGDWMLLLREVQRRRRGMARGVRDELVAQLWCKLLDVPGVRLEDAAGVQQDAANVKLSHVWQFVAAVAALGSGDDRRSRRNRGRR